MNNLDVYYRAILNYRQTTSSDHDCRSVCQSIAEADTEKDLIVIKRSFCTIDEDWVDAIESGLVHVEKAIKEERQFIRSNGEVIPIEKVKHVSKESVEHLAKHSNLITRYNEGEDIVPDKLYTVERLNDYTVYENRFLYMLLCYLRDFVTLRYNAILDLTTKYDATIALDKKISNGRKQLDYTVSMHDVRKDDAYLKENNPQKAIIDRIDLILKAVLAFLATPLMEDVSKAPMLKPPITKTNVLKMNNNFKGAVALYEFIVAYDKPGYTVENETKTISPFRDELANEMAESGGMISFLAYEYGLGLTQQLKESYAREEERRKAEEIKNRAERIAGMKRRLQATGVGIDEYVITLEKQLRALEGESARAEALADEVLEHKKNIKALNEIVGGLRRDILTLNETIEAERQRHFEEINALKKAHEDEMHALIVAHEQKIEQMIAEHNAEIAAMREAAEELKRECEERINQMNLQMEATISEMRENCDNMVAQARALTDEANATLEQRTQEYEERLRIKNDEYDLAMQDKRAAEARVKALGGVNRDYTDRESFDELEKEYQAFTKIYKDQWSKAKKTIRKRHLNAENIKGNTENAKDSE